MFPASSRRLFASLVAGVCALGFLLGTVRFSDGGTVTWDGKHETSQIHVRVVYFVPADREPLLDWRDRVEYHCSRISQFHDREFGGQSTLDVVLHPEPFVSNRTTAELRQGNGDAIFFRTLREVDAALQIDQQSTEAFPILLVLSEINWRPLDDFFRLKPSEGELVFEGNFNGTEHFPGAASGGARATYLADRGMGWGLVSADGWRVPYRGSDCVVYHEGVGHTVGLPHPQPGNGSVMSLGQYRGWISESWLDKEQKLRLGWMPPVEPREPSRQMKLFSTFRALPEPRLPRPGEPVQLLLDWPQGSVAGTVEVKYQTALESPWVEVPQIWDGEAPDKLRLATFDRPTPVSYRVNVELASGETAELWGYFQVRESPGKLPMPRNLSRDLVEAPQRTTTPTIDATLSDEEVDLIQLQSTESAWKVGDWSTEEGTLVSPKRYGARIELPYEPPAEYRAVYVVEPLDEPNGLILGQKMEDRRFVTLVQYAPGEGALSALENVQGRNVGNETTFRGSLLKQRRLSQVVVDVTKRGVQVSVDGRRIIAWTGQPEELSLSDYWKTPDDRALFVGSYDCRYRFHRITLEPLSREDHVLEPPVTKP